MISTYTKICKRCGNEKPLEDFHRQSAQKDGRQTYCKLCANEYKRKKAGAIPSAGEYKPAYKVHEYTCKGCGKPMRFNINGVKTYCWDCR